MKKTYCVATAILKEKDKYFLAKRATSKSIKPGLWEFVTGFVEDHEAAEDTILREIQEEIGLKGAIVQPLDSFQMEEVSCRWIIIPFLVTVDSSKIQTAPEEHSEGKWVTWDELEKIPQPDFRYDKQKIKQLLASYS